LDVNFVDIFVPLRELCSIHNNRLAALYHVGTKWHGSTCTNMDTVRTLSCRK